MSFLSPDWRLGPLLVATASILLLGLSAWEEEAYTETVARALRRRSGVTPEPPTRPPRRWSCVSPPGVRWERSSGCGRFSRREFVPSGLPAAEVALPWTWLAAGLTLAGLTAGMGWILGRVAGFPQGLRFGLAPYHGLAMWLLWLWACWSGVAAERRPRSRTPGGRGFEPRRARSPGTRLGHSGSVDGSTKSGCRPGGRSAGARGGGRGGSIPHGLYPVYGETVDHPLGSSASSIWPSPAPWTDRSGTWRGRPRWLRRQCRDWRSSRAFAAPPFRRLGSG